ncbi:hypothetical protein BKA56DRAFT_580178 [Ilyonectria sp. MPI-CAGE-AT-0026]|nr:hypothetical protein BKA56DRAFT_580178 [Ilyonectria sp. MPI-CAGE-AT-0026]
MNSLKISFISQTFFQATAVVILLFVPFIFSSTLFSSWFFGPDGLDVANEYWIFWAISAPLTVVVLILTFLSYSLRSGIHTRLFRQRDDPMVPEPSPTSTQVLPVQTRESNV